jgi:hypothetical protein
MVVSLGSAAFSPPTPSSYVWNWYNQVGKSQISAGQRGVQTVQNAVETILTCLAGAANLSLKRSKQTNSEFLCLILARARG